MENPQEVRELRNKLRMMKFPGDDILNVVRKQQRAIEKQKKANETIRVQIETYEAEIAHYDKSFREYNTSEQRQQLETKKKSLTNKLGLLQADFKAEDDKRRKLEDQVSRARSKAGGMFAQARENEEMQFRISTMENRLDKALNNYNKHLKKLESCRNEIDELRKERFNFIEVYTKLEKEEKERFETISHYIDISNKCYTIRDQKKIDLVELQKDEKQDQLEDEAELQRLQQKISDQAVLSRNPKTEQQAIPSISSTSTTPADFDEELKNQMKNLQTQINQILANAKVNDIDELLQKLQDLENDNFSLYSFVVERGAEKAALIEEIDELKKRAQDLSMNNQVNEDEQNYKLKELAQVMTNTDKNIETLTEVKKKNDDTIIEVHQKLQDLYNKLNLSWNGVPDEKDFVTPFNCMWILSNLENYLSNLMNQVLNKASNIQLQPKDSSSSSDHHKLSSQKMLRSMQSTIFDRSVENKTDFTAKDILAETVEPLTPDEIRARLNTYLRTQQSTTLLTDIDKK